MTNHELSREASKRMGLAVLAELEVSPNQVAADSLSIEGLGSSDKVRVTWEGIAFMDARRFQEILAEAQK